MSATQRPDGFETLTVTSDLAMAGVVRSCLESGGFEVLVPDETTAGVAWHLGQAIGGIRVQVRASELPAAKSLLESLDLEDNGGVEEGAEPELSAGDRLAHRAFKASVIGTLLVPVMPHALSLSVEAFRCGGLSRTGVRKAGFAALLSLGWLAFGLYLITRL